MLGNLQDFIPTLAFVIFTFNFPTKIEIKSLDFISICVLPSYSMMVGNNYTDQPIPAST